MPEKKNISILLKSLLVICCMAAGMISVYLICRNITFYFKARRYQEKLAELIADKTAAYIASKGDALGLDCTPQVETQPREGVPYPSAVTLDIPEDAALAAWISEELAIDRAHQYWREADE